MSRDGDALGREFSGRRRSFGLGPHHHGLHRLPLNDGNRLEGIDRSVGKISYGAACNSGQSFGIGASATIGVLDRLRLSRIDVLQCVVDGLIFRDIGIGELLHDKRDLGEVLELELHA